VQSVYGPENEAEQITDLGDDVNLDTFVDRTRADIMALCREAGMNAIRDATANDSDDVAVTTTHFDDAFSDVEPTDQPSKIIESASAPKASSSS
jgi:SpoVK/Ycf46/Vps4 family AAA+-type ATPase